MDMELVECQPSLFLKIVVFLLRQTKQRKRSLFFFQVTTTTDHLDIVQTKLLRFVQDICLLMSTDNCHMQKSHKQTDKKNKTKKQTNKKKNTF